MVKAGCRVASAPGRIVLGLERAAGCLLREGRKHEKAMRQFKPHTEIKDPNPAARTAAAAALLRRGLKSDGQAMERSS